jgi:starvation-inducible outer membrane lipoprotein
MSVPKFGVVQASAVRCSDVSHEAVLRPTSSFARCPTGTQHIGRFTIDAIGWVDPELITHPLVDAGRTQVGIKVRQLGRDFRANQQV